MAMSTISSSLTPERFLFHVNVPTRDQATVAVAQVSDTLKCMDVSSQSMRARPATSNHAMVAYKLMSESPEMQQVVAQVVSDPDVFTLICKKLQTIPIVRNIVENVRSCLLPRDDVDLAEKDKISSSAGHKSGRVRMIKMVVKAVTYMWNKLMDMFASEIPRIQPAFAREGDAAGDSLALETNMIITGLVVLVIVVILVGTVLVL